MGEEEVAETRSDRFRKFARHLESGTYVWVWDNGTIVETPCAISFIFDPPHVCNVGIPELPDGALTCVEQFVRTAPPRGEDIRTFSQRDYGLRVVDGRPS